MERDRAATEQRLLDTIGQMIAEQGLEKLGINAVAARSGISKILIYRYFGSMDGLIAAYIRKHDFWLNASFEFSDTTQIVPAIKAMFRQHIDRLRSDAVLRKLYRWELSCQNELIADLRAQREKIGLNLIEQARKLTGLPQREIAVFSSLIIASVTYLAMLGDYCPVYNGLNIEGEKGWDDLKTEIEHLLDRLLTT